MNSSILDVVCKEFTFKVLEKIINKLYDKSTINHLDEHGMALIHYFSGINYYEAIRLIAKNGADLNLRTKEGKYPLLIAAAAGHEATV